MKALSFLFTIAFVGVLVTFAIANQNTTEISFWPFPGGIALPVFLLIYGGFLVGFIVGGFFTWINRKKSKKQRPNNQSDTKAAPAQKTQPEAPKIEEPSKPKDGDVPLKIEAD